jgi:imidazolonepropionase-like amidohydrolase
MRTRAILTVFVLLGGGWAGARAQGREAQVVVLKGARIVPVVGEDIPEGLIVIKGGKIEAVGRDVPVPAGARVVDARGLIAYPGMIDAYTSLGLQEITGVSATVDNRETGRINPQVRTIEALRYDSMHIPIARSNGVTAALVVPSGGVISGQSALIKLDGWTEREMSLKASAFLHLELPGIPGGRGGTGMRGGGDAGPQDAAAILAEVRGLLREARFQAKRREAAAQNLLLPPPRPNDALTSLLPVVRGELPVMISVHSEKDIKAAIQFVTEEKIKAVFYGVEQGWKVAEDLKKAEIPVVVGSLYDLPPVWEDGYDALFLNPGILIKAGVKVGFSSSSSTSAKDLPYHAAKAAAFGLDKREALKAVTISTAEIFGVADLMGSLEEGKLANIVLADDDILELRTNVKKVYIEGRDCDLSNRYTELLEKFKRRNR